MTAVDRSITSDTATTRITADTATMRIWFASVERDAEWALRIRTTRWPSNWPVLVAPITTEGTE